MMKSVAVCAFHTGRPGEAFQSPQSPRSLKRCVTERIRQKSRQSACVFPSSGVWSIFPASSTAKAGRKQRKSRKQGTMEAGLEPAGTGYEPAVEPSTILKTVAVGAFSGSSHKGVRKLAASSVLSACRYKLPSPCGFFLEKKLRTLLFREKFAIL